MENIHYVAAWLELSTWLALLLLALLPRIFRFGISKIKYKIIVCLCVVVLSVDQASHQWCTLPCAVSFLVLTPGQ